MLTPQTDLTENRDFSGGQPTISLTPIIVSNDEIDNLIHDADRIKIFGERGHRNEAEFVFPKTLSETVNGSKEEICWCCGRVVRLPWKYWYQLCEFCNNPIAMQPFVKKDKSYISRTEIFQLR